MARSKIGKRTVRMSVTLDEGEHDALTRLGEALDLSAAWMIRRAVSEFIARHGVALESDLPLQRPQLATGQKKQAEGARGD